MSNNFIQVPTLSVPRWPRCVLALLLIVYSDAGAAAAVCPKPARSTTPVRLLIVTGGHDYEPVEFFRAFDGMKNVRYDHVMITERGHIGAVPVGGLHSYDVVLFYDEEESKAITEEWKGLLTRGTGLVFLHHSLGSFPGSPEYKSIVGGHANFDDEKYPGVPSSRADDNVRQHFSIIDHAHPITCDSKDFDAVDEPYGDVDIDPGTHALLKSDYVGGMPLLAWTWAYEGKRVFYLQMGHGSLGLPQDHGPTAYQNASFLHLLSRGILWAAGRL